MRRHVQTLVVLCAAGLLVGQGLAQEEGRPGRRRREGARAGRREGRGERGQRPNRAKEMFDRLIAELKLTEKQDAPVRQVLETHQQEMAQWMRENGPAMRELQMKLRGGAGRRGAEGGEAPERPKLSPEERKKATEQLREFMKQRTAKTENLFKQLDEHLTDEQMAVARRILSRGRGPGGPLPLSVLRQLDLTEQQQAKVKEIVDAARKGSEDKEPRARGQAMRQAWDRIAKEVLTDEQRKKLEEIRQRGPARGGAAGGIYAGLDLTEDQQKKIQEIMTAAREKIAAAEGREAKREAWTAARKKIAEEVLTAEQREKMQQRRREGRRGGRREGEGASRRGGRRSGQGPVVVD